MKKKEIKMRKSHNEPDIIKVYTKIISNEIRYDLNKSRKCRKNRRIMGESIEKRLQKANNRIAN